MKGLFPQYDHSNNIDFAETWKSALFVFDTNVLLNLYRYQESTREELLSVIEKLSERICLPHHVALEFQRNRLTVIAGQSKRFTDIRRVIESAKANLSKEIHNLQLKQRHALINPEPLISGFEELTKNFLEELNHLQEDQQTLTAPDPLKLRIETLFDEKVGTAFQTQPEIDKINKEAEDRYKNKIPPGYKDENKDKSGQDEFSHNGLIYKRKYGDYFVWLQLLAKASTHQTKKLIFITDDAKEDWWSQIELDGPKTIGPRVELIEEAFRVGKLDTFLMYKPEAFLSFAKEFLEAKISDETLEEVRDVSSANKNRGGIAFDPTHPLSKIFYAIAVWILETHTFLEESSGGYPDFVATSDGRDHAYDVRIVRAVIPAIFLNSINQAIHTSLISKFATITIICVIDDDIELAEVVNAIRGLKFPSVPDNIFLAIGRFDKDIKPHLKIGFEARLIELANWTISKSSDI
jgi:hypothetical protein